LHEGDEEIRQKNLEQEIKNKAFETLYEDESDFDELDILED
jgi:hypothetical protein